MLKRFADLVIDPTSVIAVSKVTKPQESYRSIIGAGAVNTTESFVLFKESDLVREATKLEISAASADLLLKHLAKPSPKARATPKSKTK